MFRRRHARSTPSGELQVQRGIRAAQLARLAGGRYHVDELPITQGLAQLHADVISTLDLYAEDERGNRIRQTPEVLEQPDPDEDRCVTIHKLVQSLWWEGNAYSDIRFGRRSMQISIKVLNPSAVGYQPHPDPRRDLEIDHWIVHGEQRTTDQVNHWKLNDDPRRGPLGASPLRRCWTALENYAWAYSYLAQYFIAGGDPTLVLRSNIALTDAEAVRAQADWVGSSSSVRVLTPQWTVERGPGGVSDLEHVVKVLDFAAQEVCRATNVAPSIANVTAQGTMSYSNTKDELARWGKLSLRPTWLRRLEDGFTRLLDPGLRARFDADALTEIDLAADSTTNAAAPAYSATPAPPQLRAVS